MGWHDGHLHQFEIGRRVFGVPDSDAWFEVEDERRVKLSDVAPAPKARLRYEYDFGDGWEHDILVEKTLPPTSTVRATACIDGRRSCPPEDVGGVWGYQAFAVVASAGQRCRASYKSAERPGASQSPERYRAES
jgi:hypothetical protein